MAQTNERVTFEEIVLRLAGDDLIDIINHPDPHRYPGQRIFIVRVGEHIMSVPFVENDETIFLKTIIPSRRMKKIYQKKKSHET